MLEVSGLTPWDGEWMWSSETPRSRSSVGCAGPSGAGLARWSSTSSVPRSFFGGGMTRSTRSVIVGHPSAPSTLSASDRLLDGRRSGRRLPFAHRAWARSSQTRNWLHSGSSQGPLSRGSRVGSGPGQDRNLAIPASSMPPWWSDRCPRIWAWRHRIVVTGFANGCQFCGRVLSALNGQRRSPIRAWTGPRMARLVPHTGLPTKCLMGLSRVRKRLPRDA